MTLVRAISIWPAATIMSVRPAKIRMAPSSSLTGVTTGTTRPITPPRAANPASQTGGMSISLAIGIPEKTSRDPSVETGRSSSAAPGARAMYPCGVIGAQAGGSEQIPLAPGRPRLQDRGKPMGGPMPTDFAATRAAFALPEDVIYLDGNSLGPLPRAAAARVAECVTKEWGEMLITAWNRAGWMDLPRRLGDRIGRLIGAAPGTVVLGDTLSIKVYQALASALEMRPGRRVILSDTGNFPSDLYIADGLVRTLGHGYELRTVAPEAVEAAITSDVAVLMLTEVDYRTGRRHDMAALTEKARSAGALAVWDLAHSAGAVEVDLTGARADFAVGCTYKYLNSGPGGPAFIYIAPHLAPQARPALSGWLGHEAPFAFDPDYRPGAGIER